jgi:enamine deaminase RidA (YjgF/YER057c/UK114 family)
MKHKKNDLIIKQAVRPDDIPEPVMHYSPVIRTGNLVFISGGLATDYRTGLAPECRLPYRGRNIECQTKVLFGEINKLVRAADSSLDNIIMLNEFLNDWDNGALFFDERKKQLPEDGPAATTVVVNPFIIPECDLEINGIAFTKSSGWEKELIRTQNAPQGPDPQAVKAGPWVFTSGIMATDYENGVAPEARVNKNNWYRSEIKTQARYIFKNLATILEAAGSSLEHVAKVRVDLIDIEDFSGFEGVWKEYFPNTPPARTVVKVNKLGVIGCRVQISAIAVTQDGEIKLETVNAPGISPQLTHEPHATRAGGLLFLSAQMPFDEKGLAEDVKLHPAVPYYGQSIKKQLGYTLERVRAICEAGGTSLDNMVKRWLLHTDLTELDQDFELWREYFPEVPPAGTTVEVEGPHLIPGSTFLLDVIAAVSE